MASTIDELVAQGVDRVRLPFWHPSTVHHLQLSEDGCDLWAITHSRGWESPSPPFIIRGDERDDWLPWEPWVEPKEESDGIRLG